MDLEERGAPSLEGERVLPGELDGLLGSDPHDGGPDRPRAELLGDPPDLGLGEVAAARDHLSARPAHCLVHQVIEVDGGAAPVLIF